MVDFFSKFFLLVKKLIHPWLAFLNCSFTCSHTFFDSKMDHTEKFELQRIENCFLLKTTEFHLLASVQFANLWDLTSFYEASFIFFCVEIVCFCTLYSGQKRQRTDKLLSYRFFLDYNYLNEVTDFTLKNQSCCAMFRFLTFAIDRLLQGRFFILRFGQNFHKRILQSNPSIG